jgi:hypothetical protein
MGLDTKQTGEGCYRFRFSVLVQDNEDVWIAHCLEMDIVGTGATPEAASDEVIELCEWQLEEAIKAEDVESVMNPAPPEVWARFFTIMEETSVPKKKLQRIDRVETRELVEV